MPILATDLIQSTCEIDSPKILYIRSIRISWEVAIHNVADLCHKISALIQQIRQKATMPPVATVVRDNGVRLGRFLTVCRDPQAKKPDSIKPTAKPMLTDRLCTITPLASTPPIRAKSTEKKTERQSFIV